ncbi:ion channel [Plantibacter flavus]|uniref:potassium channel family protein n=1 Tax=Plantibacter flavus TaxID=150123 RepID=UPI0023785D70|nr:potassium channel family protein [Plantibacter flavus]MDD9151497.1 ion channel [Plantibacter flavus]
MTQARWQKLTEWPLAIAAVVFLAAYSYEVIAEPGGSIAEVIIAATWVVFVADYIVNLVLARPRWRWFYTHLLDLAIVVLPLLRPLRLLRLVTLLAILNRTAGAAFRGRVIIYAAGASTLLVYVAGLAVLDAERGGDGSIQTLGQALWWAFVTITTVGYGDYFPVTYTGQLVAVGVMIGGIALIGVVTATLASWIVERVEQREAVSEAITSAHIEALTNEITSLRQLIEGKVGETPPASAKYPGGPPLGGSEPRFEGNPSPRTTDTGAQPNGVIHQAHLKASQKATGLRDIWCVGGLTELELGTPSISQPVARLKNSSHNAACLTPAHAGF